jgi:uncharacterized Zn-binding protein involved in type VI secretion
MPEVKTVTVQVRGPKGDDPGQVAMGAYTLEDNILTMVTPDGRPIRRTNGEPFRCKLQPGANCVGIAGQMTLEIRGMMRGENSPGAVKGFNRQLDYQNTGWR